MVGMVFGLSLTVMWFSLCMRIKFEMNDLFYSTQSDSVSSGFAGCISF